MGSEKLPLKARSALRAKWELSHDDVRHARLALSESLGCSIKFSVPWLDLLHVIDNRIGNRLDHAQIIEYLVNGIHSWLKVMLEIEVWEDPKSRDWIEEMPSPKGGGGGAFYVMKVEVRTDDGTKVRSYWEEKLGCFVVVLPGTPGSLDGDQDFAKQFRIPLLKELRKPPIQTRATPVETSKPIVVEPKPDSNSSSVSLATGNTLDLEAVPSIEDLLNNPPYHLSVKAVSRHNIELQSSHWQSLHLLAKYIERSTAVRPREDGDKALSVVVQRKNETSALEQINVLLLTPSKSCDDPATISPMVILAVVEGLLGYELVHTEAGYWYYRRTTPFKSKSG